MQAIIFFTLAISALVFVIYLGARSTMKGMKAKSERLTEEEKLKNLPENNTGMISELEKLNELYKSGALSEEEFNKAKAKLLKN
jgi:hypothetical protein|tara:strand:- start:375 stop:626 length:252 start_codon:yes stop_codon:yes gene_type:complete